MLKFLRKYRGMYVLATALVIMIQIPTTFAEIPRIGTGRYLSEIGEGISRAFTEAWRGR